MPDAHDRDSEGGTPKDPPRCSFCNKAPGDATPLIEGPIIEGSHRAYICGDCVELCAMIIEQQRARGDAGEDPLGGDAGEDPLGEATQKMLREKVDRVLDVLSPREREIIKLRYGLADGYTYTLEEVGRMFDITRQQVREIEARAAATLKSKGPPPDPEGDDATQDNDHL
jgi:RNA polymerase sigma factor (sigma-70 family)